MYVEFDIVIIVWLIDNPIDWWINQTAEWERINVSKGIHIRRRCGKNDIVFFYLLGIGGLCFYCFSYSEAQHCSKL